MRLAGAVFALTLIALGAWGLAGAHFAPIWQPVPTRWPAREALVWVTGLVSVACGLALLWKRTQAAAAAVLAALLLIWMLATKAPVIVAAPLLAVAWESAGETAVLAAAAWALFAQAAPGRGLRFVAGPSGLRLARILYGLAMLAFGAAHLAYVKATAALVPGWLPDHTAWVWVTGLAYIAAGLAILTGVLARLAASLSAAQMGLFTLLVWAPVLAGGHAGADDLSEAAISWALTAAGLVVAASYAGERWVALRRRGR